MCTVVGTSGNDVLVGTSGSDVVCGLGGNDVVDGGGGNDVVDGGLGNDIVRGGVGDDVLFGGAGSDIVNGGVGNDVVRGGVGSDSIDGGVGVDTVSYAERLVGVVADLDGFRDDGAVGENDLIAGAENLTGGSGNDTLTGDGQANTLDGGAGNDSIYGLVGVDRVIGGLGVDELDGGADADVVQGGPGNDAVFGGAGDDALDGGAGNDSLYGNEDNDTLTGGAGSDTTDGGAGVDSVSYVGHVVGVVADLDGVRDDGAVGENDLIAGAENLTGGSGNDTLTGDGASNRLDGGVGNDVVRGGDGVDSVSGGEGNDIVSGGVGNDVVSGGAGNDVVNGDAGNDVANGGVGNDVVSGGVGNDVLIGGAGSDTTDGGVGVDSVSYVGHVVGVVADLDGVRDDGAVGENDLIAGAENLTGGSGDDTLTGDGAANRLDGGAGGDLLWGVGGADTVSGGTGDDVLSGGDGVDLLNGGTGLNVCDYTATEPRTTTCIYDDNGPVIESFSVSPAIVEVGTSEATTVFTVRATDQTGAKQVTIGCWASANDRSYQAANISLLFDTPISDVRVAGDRARLLEWSGDARDFTAQVEVTVPFGLYPGQYTCDSVRIDHIDRSAGWNPVGSFTITRTGDGFDDSGPVVESFVASPASVEVGQSSAATVVTVRVTDQTGAASVSFGCWASLNSQTYQAASFTLQFDSPTAELRVNGARTRLVEWSGDARDVTAQIEVTVPFALYPGQYNCDASGTDHLGQNTSWKPVGNLTVTRTGTGFDDQGPVVESFSAAPGSVEVGTSSALTLVTVRVTDQTGVASATFACSIGANGQSYTSVNFNLQFDSPTSTPFVGDGFGGDRARLISWSGDARDITAEVEVTVPFGLYPGVHDCSSSRSDHAGHWTSWTHVGSLTVTRTPPA